MRNVRAAGRYAKALFEIALERGMVQEVHRDLQTAMARLESMPEVKNFVEQHFVATASKRRAIEVALEGAVSDTVLDFFRILVGKDRADQLDVVCREYRELWLAHEGLETAKVSSAVPLTSDEIGELSKTLSQLTGKRVEVQTQVDPSLLGGVVAVVGDRVWDGSVRGSLERLRREMKGQDVVGRLRASRS
ncbi:MAG: ATP synthase F1 subunit delta [Armatimonadia bacterium]|nr:ATP synthase F1 subunit delta [Armatimonadia bacterium]